MDELFNVQDLAVADGLFDPTVIDHRALAGLNAAGCAGVKKVCFRTPQGGSGHRLRD
jgi:hypothetical protein